MWMDKWKILYRKVGGVDLPVWSASTPQRPLQAIHPRLPEFSGQMTLPHILQEPLQWVGVCQIKATFTGSEALAFMRGRMQLIVCVSNSPTLVCLCCWTVLHQMLGWLRIKQNIRDVSLIERIPIPKDLFISYHWTQASSLQIYYTKLLCKHR